MSLAHFSILFLILYAAYATGQGQIVPPDEYLSLQEYFSSQSSSNTDGVVVPCPGDGEYRLDYHSIGFNSSEFLISSILNSATQTLL